MSPAIVVLPLGAAILFVILGAIAGAALAGTRCLQNSPDTAPVPESQRASLVTHSVLLGITASPAAAGLLGAFGLIGFALLPALAMSSPAARRSFVRPSTLAAGDHEPLAA